METINTETINEISLERILFILAKRWVVLVICVVFGAMIAFGVSEFIISEKYTANTTMYIGLKQANENGEIRSASTSSLYFNRELLYTYSVIVKSESLMKLVSENLKEQYGIDYTSTQLSNMVTASSVENTEILKISVTCKDAVDAATIANVIAEEAPEEFKRVTNASFVSVLDPAKVPNSPSSPNTKKNVLLGMLIAFILSAVLCLVIDLTDTSIKDIETLEKNFDYPVLGNIPAWDMDEEQEDGQE